MFMIRLIGPIVATGLLTACGTLNVANDVKALREVQPQGSEFTQSLASGYRTFVIFENDEMYDWIDADYFARKGLQAAAGNAVEPEEPANWRIPAHAASDIRAGQQRLQTALRAGARDWAPRQAAQAQVNFDCWIEQQEEDWQRDHIAACRNGFETAMRSVDDASRARTGSTQTTTTTAAAPVLAPQPPRTAASTQLAIVFFDFDKAVLSPEARDIIRGALNKPENSGAKAGRLEIAGHADRSGTDQYNDELSTTRAESVLAELVNNGVASNRVTVRAYGEHQPMVATPDGVREPMNRRVEIRVAPGS